MLFFIAERLHMSVVAVERMSNREVQGWLTWWQPPRAQTPAAEVAPPDDDAVELRTLSKAELRRMFG